MIQVGWRTVTVSSQVRLASCGLATSKQRTTMHVVVGPLLSGCIVTLYLVAVIPCDVSPCIRCAGSEAWMQLAALPPAAQ